MRRYRLWGQQDPARQLAPVAPATLYRPLARLDLQALVDLSLLVAPVGRAGLLVPQSLLASLKQPELPSIHNQVGCVLVLILDVWLIEHNPAASPVSNGHA